MQWSTVVIKMSSGGNIAKVTIDSAEKAGHCPLIYGLATYGLMTKKPGISTGHYGIESTGAPLPPSYYLPRVYDK